MCKLLLRSKCVKRLVENVVVPLVGGERVGRVDDGKGVDQETIPTSCVLHHARPRGVAGSHHLSCCVGSVTMRRCMQGNGFMFHEGLEDKAACTATRSSTGSILRTGDGQSGFCPHNLLRRRRFLRKHLSQFWKLFVTVADVSSAPQRRLHFRPPLDSSPR